MVRYLSAVLLALSTTPSAATTDPSRQMEAGLWEISVLTETASARNIPPTVVRTCYTQQEIDSGELAIPKNEQCLIDNYQVSGNTATWSVRCESPRKILGSGSISFSGSTSYSGTVTLLIESPGLPEMRVDNHYRGQRVGSCQE